MNLKKISLVALLTVSIGFLSLNSASVFAGSVKKGPKANAPAMELTDIIKKWQDDKLSSDEVRKIVKEQYAKTWQRVNVTAIVKGTKKINVRPAPGLPHKASKSMVVTKMEYYKKGGFTFVFYVLLPKGESYPDGDRLSITNAYIESNRGYKRPRIKLVLIGGEVEQLPPE